MTSGFARWVMAATVVAAGLALGAGAQPPAAPAAVQDTSPLVPKDKDDVSTSFTACKKCHNYASRDDAKKDDYAIDHKSNQFVLLSEGTTWKQQDPHSSAFEVLESGLGKQMSDLLKANPAFKDGVSKAPQCLTCHAIDLAPATPLAAKTAEHFDGSEGITCNACHGIRPAWQDKHFKDKGKGKDRYMPWRVTAPEQKEVDGLRNLRDPAVRAAFCASCHVGSAAEGKVVTHEMYAAGHPPLPPFELGTFMECQPKHWGYPIDPSLTFFTGSQFVEYADRAKAKIPTNWQWDLYRFHPADKEVFMARSVVAGAVASLQAEMRMLAANAKEVAADPKADGIDYARFDCYACHHNLVANGDRQRRGYDGYPPGRPPMKAWLGALPGIVAEHADTLPPLAGAGKAFQQKWAAVRKAALSRPFGDPAEVKTKAAEMAEWCEDFFKKSANGGQPLYTQAESERLMAAIGAAATSERWTADPEAAMHLTWAYLSLRHNGAPNWKEPAVERLAEVIPVRVRVGEYTRNNLPVPASESIGPRLDLFGKFRAADFTGRFHALQKK
jgi:hypothetical protein